MRQVIESIGEFRECMCIERKQPSTAFRSMFAFVKIGGIVASLKADELTSTFNALNETINFRPTKGESVSIVHPTFKTGYDPGPVGSPIELKSLDVGPVNKTTQDWVPVTWFESNKLGIVHPDFRNPVINPDSMRPVDELTGISDSFGCGDTNPVYAIWQDCNDIKSDQDNNNLVFQISENIDWTAANGGPGSSYMTETIEPVEAMNSFAGSFNPVPEDEGFQPRDGVSVEIGRPPDPKFWLQMLG